MHDQESEKVTHSVLNLGKVWPSVAFGQQQKHFGTNETSEQIKVKSKAVKKCFSAFFSLR